MLHHVICLPLPRQNDSYTMLDFLQVGCSLQDLVAANRCRLFLHILFPLDIVNGDGIHLSEASWQGTQTEGTRPSWPSHGRPSKKDWETWRACLRKTYSLRGRKINQALGGWELWDSNWQLFSTNNSGHLYRHWNNAWWEHKY